MTDPAGFIGPPLAVFTPLAAAGTAAAAVALPVLVHLLFRKRYHIIPWAAVRFLVAAERRHRRRIDQWVLLALRVLALVLPLFAMIAATAWAERLWQQVVPGLPETVATAPRTHHVLLLDASHSMSAKREDGRTRWETALDQAEEMVGNGRPGDGYTVLLLTGGPPAAVVPGPSAAPDKVVAELRKLRPTHAAADTAAALPAVADILTRSPRAYPRRQVTVFTDLQRSAWANALPRPDGTIPEAWAPILKGKDGRGAAEVVVVDAAGADVDNLAVADLALADPLPLVDTPAALTATVANYGKAERRSVRVELRIGRPGAGDTLASVVSTVIEAPIPPGGRAPVTFPLDGPRTGFQTPGLYALQVRLTDGDDLPADDARGLAVEVRAGVHALIVDGRKGAAEPLRRAGEHLARALVPPGSRPADTPARLHRPGQKWPATPDDRWVLSAAEFADPALGDPTGAECLFLCDLPTLTPAVVAKLDVHLKRGGGVVIGLGPNAAAAAEQYNRLLYAEGNGLLPGPLGEVVTAPPDDPGYRLFADEAAYRQAPTPLGAFRDENARAGLATVPFKSYLRMDAPADGRARRLLSFVPAVAPAAAPGAPKRPPDPAVVEWPRHRGRVIVYTSSFNQDWTDWPVLPSYLPFMHELLRFAAANPDRHTVRVGDKLDEFFPPAAAGLTAGLSGPDGKTATLPIELRDEAGVAEYADATLGGFYRLGVGAARDRVFAVNPPETSPGGGTEFDLKRVDPADLKAVGPLQIVSDPADYQPGGDETGVVSITTPRPHGPTLARWALWAALAALLLEVVLAWRFGPARTPGAGAARAAARHTLLRLVGTAVALVPLAVAFLAVLIVARVEWANDLVGVVPDRWWQAVDDGVAWLAGVPAAPAGESTRVILERSSVTVRNAGIDRLVLAGLAAGFVALTIAVYRRERTAAGGWWRAVVPAGLRMATFLLVLGVLLPQWRLVFKREGWPDIVLILDTSASMATEDDFKDPAVRAKAAELVGAAGTPVDRLKLAQLLLTRPDADWLDRLLTEKRLRVHVYAADESVRPVGTASEEGDTAAVREALKALRPLGEESKLGDAVRAVGKAFQGGTLAGVVMVTDGVTTAGPDLPTAADAANAPLYLIGVGDPWVVPDLRLSDPVLEDYVLQGDTLDVRARLTARGAVPADAVPVVLYERVGGRLVERARTTAPPSPAGAAVKVTYTPTEVGEKTLVLEVPTVPGEADTSNNRIERRVVVAEAKRARVLFVEGDPRYDFRFAKVLFEREMDKAGRGRAVDFKTVLLGAGRGWAETDGSALADFPTREQLFEYDVVILGDFDPRQLPRSSRVLQDLADFVAVKGGGLLVAAGEHHSPAAFADTPLADVLPVVPTEGTPPAPTPEDRPLTEGFRPTLTPTGKSHPLFRFSPDPAEADRVWGRLQPLLWHARGYRRKPAAEVLAVHPTRPAEGGPGRENHPLVLQQFVGAGRVIFLGIDETWRWRFRADETQFNRFWTQAVRTLARSRRARTELKLEPGGGPFRRGDRVTVRVRFPDDAPPPAADTVVRVRLERGPLPSPDGSPGPGETTSKEIVLTRVKGERAEFEAVETNTPEGEYRFTLTSPDAGPAPARAEAKVLPPPAERERVDLNRADLQAAAERSHGAFYTLADADKVFDDLRDLEPVPLNDPRPPLPLWNEPAVFLLLACVLAAEWLLRKRERLL